MALLQFSPFHPPSFPLQPGRQREVSQQVPDPGREQDLRPQHPLQLAGDLHVGLHRRLLHQLARLQAVSWPLTSSVALILSFS